MNKPLTMAGAVLCFLLVPLTGWAAPTPPRIAVIDVTDLHHPPQDAGDHFDLTYQSYGLPGGPERGKKCQGQRFHDDLSVQPVAVGVLGRQYLDQIQRMLEKLDLTQKPKLLLAAQWWKQAGSASTLVTGHMFPRHGAGI